MTDSVGSSLLAYLWQDAVADDMSEAERLVYRSNLLGSDMRVTNYGGGNTSSKIVQIDPQLKMNLADVANKWEFVNKAALKKANEKIMVRKGTLSK